MSMFQLYGHLYRYITLFLTNEAIYSFQPKTSKQLIKRFFYSENLIEMSFGLSLAGLNLSEYDIISAL